MPITRKTRTKKYFYQENTKNILQRKYSKHLEKTSLPRLQEHPPLGLPSDTPLLAQLLLIGSSHARQLCWVKSARAWQLRLPHLLKSKPSPGLTKDKASNSGSYAFWTAAQQSELLDCSGILSYPRNRTGFPTSQRRQ